MTSTVFDPATIELPYTSAHSPGGTQQQETEHGAYKEESNTSDGLCGVQVQSLLAMLEAKTNKAL